MDIVTFLRKRIVEDKKEAEFAISSQADKGWSARFIPDFHNYVITPHVGTIHEGVQARHVEKWDPWRVIAECEAKEKILELHEQWPVLVERQVAPERGADNLSDPIVRALAHPYRHHPDFNPEWSIT